MRKFLSLAMAVTMLLSVAFVLPVSAEEAEKVEDKIVWNDLEGKDLAEDRVAKGFLSSEPTTLDPQRASDNVAISTMYNLYEPLVLIHDGPEGGTEFLGGGAASWDISEDGSVYTFHLRDNKWWDGQEVTAEDYAYALRRAVDPTTGCPYSYMLEPILNAKAITEGKKDVEELGIKVIDEKTLEITLEGANPTFMELMGNSVTLPVRKDWIEEHGEAYGSEAEYVMGNGPMKITEWTHNSKMVMEASENYWNIENVFFTGLEWPIITDTNTIMTAFEAGEVDQTSTNLAEWREKFESKDNVIHKQKGYPSTFFMMFNTQDPDGIFSDARVRLAFSAAIDRDEINEVMWNGNNMPAMGWVAPGISVGSINYRDTAPNFVEKIQEEYPEPKTLLDEALTDMGKEDLIDNLEVSLILGNTDQWFKDMGDYYQQVFAEKLGVKVKVEQLEWPIFSDRVEQSDYQIGYMAWGSELSEPIALLQIHANGSPQVGTGWNNDEYNKLIEEAQVEMDEQKRFDLYVAAETILMEEAPVAPVVHPLGNIYLYDYNQGGDWNDFGNMGVRQGYYLAH